MNRLYKEYVYNLKEDNISALLNSMHFNISGAARREFSKATVLKKINITQNRFIYIENGEVDISVDNAMYSLKKGDLFFSKSFSVVEAATLTKNSVVYYVYFDINPIHLESVFLKQVLFSKSHFHMQSKKKEIKIILENIIKSSENLKNGYYYKAQNFLNLLILAVHQSAYIGDSKISKNIYYKNEKEKYLAAATRYINDNIDINITLLDIEKEVGITKNYIYKIFKELLNTSPKEYIITHKLELAQKLLKSSDLSISEISLKLSFSSASHFNKAFKKHFGITPKKYKTSILK